MGDHPCARAAPALRSAESNKEARKYGHMTGGGWDWLWAVPMMLLWIVVLGGVVYGAARLAFRHEREAKQPLQR